MHSLLPLGLLLTLPLIACGGAEPETGAPDSSPGEASGIDLEAAAKLFIGGKASCATCHGKEGEGMMLGPEITGAAEFWTVDTLTAFLENPGRILGGDARLAEMASRYPSPMPAASSLSDAERRAVAEYVLTL